MLYRYSIYTTANNAIVSVFTGDNFYGIMISVLVVTVGTVFFYQVMGTPD